MGISLSKKIPKKQKLFGVVKIHVKKPLEEPNYEEFFQRFDFIDSYDAMEDFKDK